MKLGEIRSYLADRIGSVFVDDGLAEHEVKLPTKGEQALLAEISGETDAILDQLKGLEVEENGVFIAGNSFSIQLKDTEEAEIALIRIVGKLKEGFSYECREYAKQDQGSAD